MAKLILVACVVLCLAIFVAISEAATKKANDALLRRLMHEHIQANPGGDRRSRRLQYRKMILSKFISTCTNALRTACIPLIRKCGIQRLFKRSTEDDVTQNRVARAARHRKRSRKVEFGVSCKWCGSTCWK